MNTNRNSYFSTMLLILLFATALGGIDTYTKLSMIAEVNREFKILEGPTEYEFLNNGDLKLDAKQVVTLVSHNYQLGVTTPTSPYAYVYKVNQRITFDHSGTYWLMVLNEKRQLVRMVTIAIVVPDPNDIRLV